MSDRPQETTTILQPDIVFVENQRFEANILQAGEYILAARLSGASPVDLPPFTDLGLVPASLWQ